MGNSTQYVMTTCTTSKHNAQALFVAMLLHGVPIAYFKQLIDAQNFVNQANNDLALTIEMLGV